MDIQKINQILNLIEKSKFYEVEIQEGDDFRIKVRKTPVGTQFVSQSPLTEKSFVIKSLLVGTFYESTKPNAPLVSLGDLVKRGQVLCIVRVLQLPIEVVAEMKGKVVAIYVKNGESVEYNQPLFLIEKA